MHNNQAASRESLRVALIGAGARTSGPHYPSLKRLADVSLVAIADPDPQALNRIGHGILEVHEHIFEAIRRGCEPETSFQATLKTMQLLDDIRWGQI